MKSGGLKWVRHELAPATRHIKAEVEIWNPLDAKLVSRSYMTETNSGGGIEPGPKVNRRRAMTAGLPSGQAGSELSIREQLIAQASGGISTLTPVPETTVLPWRSICQLIISRQDGSRAYGTAWFAGPSLLVTAGHCLIDPQAGAATSIVVVPASNGTYPPPFNMWQAAGMEANDRWQREFNPQFDYGFISLSNPSLGEQLGWFGFAVVPDEKAINMLVNVAGYPNTQAAGSMWFDSGRIFAVDSAFLNYMQQTEAGESGGPVFWYGKDQRIVVAVHAYHSPAGNKGLRVTDAMYRKIQELRGF